MLPIILLVPVGRLAVDRHRVGQDARAHDVHERRHVPAGDLVQRVVRVVRHPQVGAVGVAAGQGLRPVTDGVERVIELLTRHRRAVRKILAAVGHLHQRIWNRPSADLV